MTLQFDEGIRKKDEACPSKEKKNIESLKITQNDKIEIVTNSI
jgi:hypothetical protein